MTTYLCRFDAACAYPHACSWLYASSCVTLARSDTVFSSPQHITQAYVKMRNRGANATHTWAVHRCTLYFLLTSCWLPVVCCAVKLLSQLPTCRCMGTMQCQSTREAQLPGYGAAADLGFQASSSHLPCHTLQGCAASRHHGQSFCTTALLPWSSALLLSCPVLTACSGCCCPHAMSTCCFLLWSAVQPQAAPLLVLLLAALCCPS